MDYADRYQAMYELIATDSAGAATRALLGANGLMGSRRELANLNGRVLPWLVWAYDAVSGQSGDMGDVSASWWAYIDKGKDEAGLYAIAAAVEAAYKSSRGLAITGGRLYTGSITRPIVSTAPAGVQALQIPIYYRALR